MLKQFFCELHRNWYKQICLDCFNEVFYGHPYTAEQIEYQEANYDWDDTWEFIGKLKVLK